MPERTQIFRNAGLENGVFLLKWLTFAYTIEALMVFYMPADFIETDLGGAGLGTVLLGALVGMPDCASIRSFNSMNGIFSFSAACAPSVDLPAPRKPTRQLRCARRIAGFCAA